MTESNNDKKKAFIELGKSLRKLRIDKDISRKELSLKSGLSVSYIGCLERGERNLTLQTLFNLMKALEENSITFYII